MKVNLRLHLDPRVGHVEARDLTPAYVIDLKNEELDAGYSPRTVRYVFQTLDTAPEQAVVLEKMDDALATLDRAV